MLAGEVPKATVATILAANKALRFAKANSDVKLLYPPLLDDLEDIVFIAYSDAAFASRADMSSQGGYLVCLTHKAILTGGICSYHLLDWRSFRLPRVARSTLAAEGQAASEAADSLHFTIAFWKALLDPSYRISGDERCFQWKNESLLVIDAKCLYDILHREELYVSSAADKRTCLEALVTRDKLKEIGGSVRWVSSERQYADGLTKDTATQLLADRLRTHQMKITADDTYQASRKKDAAERAKRTAPCQAEATTQAEPVTTQTGAQTDATYLVQPFPEMRTFTNRGVQTDSLLPGGRHSTLETALLELASVRDQNLRLAAAVQQQQHLLDYHTSNRLSHHHVGEIYVTPHGRVWHASDTCARSRTENRIQVRTPCSYCTDSWIPVPEHLRYNPNFRLQHVPDQNPTTAASSTTTTDGHTYHVVGETGSS